MTMTIGAWGRAVLWFVLGVVIVGIAWHGFRQWDHSDQVTLRSYEVKPEIAATMQDALREALSGDLKTPVGRVSMAPDGHHLLVSAPAAVQQGVAAAMQQLAESAPVPIPSIKFELWLVSATPGSPSTSAALAEVQPALAQIGKARGSANFQLLEKLSTVARPGWNSSEMRSAQADFRVQRPSVRGTSDAQTMVAAVITAHVHTKLGQSGQVDASVELAPGELLVIGQSSLNARDDAKASQLYYIVRATL
jgi:hypothetical protein